MAYFSKHTILEAYNQLANLTSDPSAQGATQVTSNLRYLFALDEFVRANNRPCDTQNKTDKDEFIKYVGHVVAIDNRYFTNNFFNSIKDNSDFAVGSNFFSVNTVKTSLENISKEYEYPKRSGWKPLFTIQGGKLIEREDFIPNLQSYLNTEDLRCAFAIWLLRDSSTIDNDNLFDSVTKSLRSRYSDALVNSLLTNENYFTSLSYISFSDTKATLTREDFPKSKERANNVDSKKLSPEQIAAQVRDSFIQYWQLVDQHGVDVETYINSFEKAINPNLATIGIPEKSIFEFTDIEQFNAVIGKLANEIPSLAYISNGRENNGVKYEVGSTFVHYSNFLKIISFIDFLPSTLRGKSKRIATASIISDFSHSDYLRAMRAKPFLLLAGISGTGKSRIVKQMAFDSCPDVADLRADKTSPGNYCLIEVKPNWHDSTELIGYESHIGGDHYQLTPFVRFLAKAMLYPRVPFFVCLDEMNLAPVEQYFAEFLSVLESRSKIDGHIVSEPLIKAEIFSKYPDLYNALFSRGETTPKSYKPANSTEDATAPYGKEAKAYEALRRDGLRIPENVIVIGTVNMDETTHQFSRKVIDRAMTIEMNLPEGEPFMDFFANKQELAYRDTPTMPELYLSTEVRAADVVETLAADNAEETEWLKDEVSKFLTGLNEALDGTPFKVAYRVQNELMLYFYQLWQENTAAYWREILNATCDQILMMKVLPRIEGDEELLGKPIDKLLAFCESFKNASQKLEEMKARLERSRFTSFWP